MVKYKLLGAISGSLMVALPLAIIGTFSNQVLLAIICGSVIGAFAGFYAVEGRVSSTVAGMVMLALESTILGTGCDDFSGGAGIFGAVIGAFLGYLGWPWVIGLFGLFLGLFCCIVLEDVFNSVPGGHHLPGYFQIYGIVSVGIFITIVIYLVSRRITRSRINKIIDNNEIADDAKRI